MIKHDIVVIGGGLAGMRAAVEAAERGADVAIVSKMHPVRSHSGAAQGGINAALGNREEDSPENHAFDCAKGSDYLGDQDSIEAMAESCESLRSSGTTRATTSPRLTRAPGMAEKAERCAYQVVIPNPWSITTRRP